MLYCGLGMSTSMLVEKAKREAAARGIEDLEFIAAGNAEFEKYIKQGDVNVCLIGPQVRYLLKKTRDVAKAHNCMVDVIDHQDYCNINAKKILEQALTLLQA